MSGGTTRPAGSVSLGTLIALNDEIAALVRSGMPLERGLLGVGGDLPGRLGTITTSLGQRMARGASLAEALEAEGGAMPPTYRAVVEAGMRSGRLAEALEGLAGFARNYVELRRAVGLAMIYPVIVLLVAYGLFVGFLLEVVPRLSEAFASFRVPIRGPLVALEQMGRWAPVWGPILPVMVAAVALGWLGSGRAGAFRPGKLGGVLRWVPGLAGILDGGTAGQFAEWLAILTEQGVPWAEAITLAAEATGDPRLIAPAQEVAEASRRGEPMAESLRAAKGFPPLLGWLVGAGGSRGSLAPALRHAADAYRRRALRKAAHLRATLPSLLLVLLGGSAALVYTLALFVPWTSLLTGLSQHH